MVRGEAEWKRGIWNDCFPPDKSRADSLHCVWRTKMRAHISFFFPLSFETRHFQWCAQHDAVVKPSCLRGWGSERAAAETFKTHQNVYITHVKQPFCLNDTASYLTRGKEHFWLFLMSAHHHQTMNIVPLRDAVSFKSKRNNANINVNLDKLQQFFEVICEHLGEGAVSSKAGVGGGI